MQRLALLPLALLTVLSACGHDDGLTVQGTATVITTDATRRFDFPSETRLDGTSPGRFTGTCVVRRMRDADGTTSWGVTAELRSGGTALGDATPLQRVTFVQNDQALPSAGFVEVDLGGTALDPVEGACSVELRYVLGDGSVGLTSTCRVADAAGGLGAEVAAELDFAGCDVEG
jgi:hypothetical protein